VSVLWKIPQREVMLRANLFPTTSGTTQETSYSVANPGATEMADRAIQFPPTAINDALLDSGDVLVGRIGANPHSPYRIFFSDVSSNISSGSLIPTTSSTSKPVVGVIGDVRDASGNALMNFASERVVKGYNTLKTNIVKVQPNLFYTDNVRIWHTTTNVVADMVIWSKTDQLALMVTNPRGTCPFPEDLIDLLVEGALAKVFRDNFNTAQATVYQNRFEAHLEQKLPLQSVSMTQARIAAE
jgi:hypothetical protein